MKNKSVHSCRFVHHAKFHCIMTTLNKLFKFEFERRGETGKEPNLVYIGAKGAFRKILGSVGQKWISEKVSKGGPFGSAGGRIPEGRGASAEQPPHPP